MRVIRSGAAKGVINLRCREERAIGQVLKPAAATLIAHEQIKLAIGPPRERRIRMPIGVALQRLRERDSLEEMAREARRALADGGIACAADADLASVLGAGVPAWSGGVISYQDMEKQDMETSE